MYVLNDGSNTLTAFNVNRTTGALTALAFSPITLGTPDNGRWTCVTVHPSGSPVVVGNSNGNLASFAVGATTAAAAAGSPFATGTAGPFSCEFSRNGNYVYAGGDYGNTCAGFSVNAGTGVLTALAGSPFSSGTTFPMGYATDNSGRLFSVSLEASHVLAFTTAAGVPTGASGNPFSSGLANGIHGVWHPSGLYMVADRTPTRHSPSPRRSFGRSMSPTCVPHWQRCTPSPG